MSQILGRKGMAYLALGASHVYAARRLLISEGSSEISSGTETLDAYAARRLLLTEGASELSSGTETLYIVISVVLIILSGLAAGLTLGLLSLDRVDLELIKRTGNEHQKWMASKVEPLLANPHWLLCALLLWNAACATSLPIFLDRLLNPVAAILISVSAILIFGEIFPQAVCRKFSLQIGAYSSWPVRFVMIITAPISWPLGKCLDWLLGYESALFRRAELRELVTLHAEPDEDGGESMLTAEEVQVIHGALDMAHKTAETAMTPLANVYALNADAILDRKLLESLIGAGHSRVPVYVGDDKRNIIGLILVKLLILRDTTKPIRVRDCLLREVDFIVADTPLYSVLELFRLKRRHMAVLTKSTGELDGGQDPSIHIPPGDTSNTDKEKSGEKGSTEGLLTLPTYPPRPPSANGRGLLGTVGDVIGILTLEDIFEELLAIEIADETDQYMDNEKTIRVPPLKPELPPKLSRYLSWGRKQGQAQSASHNGQGPSTRSSPTKQYGVGSSNEHNDAVIAAAAGAAFAAARQNNAHQRRASGGVSARDADAAAAVAATDVTAHPLPPSASNGGGGGGGAPAAGAPAIDKVEKKST